MTKKVLIVDDDPNILEALTVLVEEEGYCAFPVSDGQTALSKVDKVLPDLVILDVLLNDADGRVICRKLKLQKKTKNIPVVMISAQSFSFSQLKAYGADGFLPKPFDIKDLLSTLQKYL